jgi:putative FmdB family regulatory protein
MPIYEYRCQACGLEKEFLQKLSDAPITECPSCGKAAMTKLVSAAGFQLKGTGWYATDFKNSGAKPAKSDGDKAGEAKSGEASDGGSKAEAAPACGAGACPACQ